MEQAKTSLKHVVRVAREPLRYSTSHPSPYMLELSVYDHHFGKLAWGRETGHESYDLKIAETGNVDIKMTLTAPACPVAGSMPREVAEAVARVEGVGEVDVAITWDPPWTPANMSEVAKVALDMF